MDVFTEFLSFKRVLKEGGGGTWKIRVLTCVRVKFAKFSIDALSIVFFSSGLTFGIGSFSTLNAKFMARCIDVFSMMVATHQTIPGPRSGLRTWTGNIYVPKKKLG